MTTRIKAKPFRIWYIDSEPVEVWIRPSVQVKAEEKFKTGLGDMRLVTQLYYMAWLAATREGKEHRTFEQFLDVIADVEPLDLNEGTPAAGADVR